MNDTKREIEEWFKEFREHNIDATISCDIRQGIRVLDIDTSKHDATVIDDFINKLEKELLSDEVKENLLSKSQVGIVIGCAKFLSEQLKEQK